MARCFLLLLLVLSACQPELGLPYAPDARTLDAEGEVRDEACRVPETPGTQPDFALCRCNEDCASFVCATEEATMGENPGGSCARLCTTRALVSDECGGNACVELQPGLGACLQTCEGGPGSCLGTADCTFSRDVLQDGTNVEGLYCLNLCQADEECETGSCDFYTGVCGSISDQSLGRIGDLAGSRDQCRSGARIGTSQRCTALCSTYRQGCPDDAICVGDSFARLGDTVGACYASCETTADCAPGGICDFEDDVRGDDSNLGASYCWPFCQEDTDCFSGGCNRYTGTCDDPLVPDLGGIGDLASDDEDCQSDFALSGICVSFCSVSRQGCPDDAYCANVLDRDLGVCLPRCTTSADCTRYGPEYACDSDDGVNFYCF